MKLCFKCREMKVLDAFYKHARMRDGHLNKCKECTKADVKRQYQETIAVRHAYEKRRQQTTQRRTRKIGYQRLHRERNPEKYQARMQVGNAVRDGRLIRLRCELCGCENAQAHHTDYEKPLQVRWLCFACHRTQEHNQRVL